MGRLGRFRRRRHLFRPPMTSARGPARNVSQNSAAQLRAAARLRADSEWLPGAPKIVAQMGHPRLRRSFTIPKGVRRVPDP